MRPVTRWVAVMVGLASLWWVTRAAAFYFFAVLAFFVTAFQATVNELTKRFPSEPPAPAEGEGTPRVPRRPAETRAFGRPDDPAPAPAAPGEEARAALS